MSALTTFEFRAVDRAGGERRGVVTAADRSEAYRKVASGGVTPVSLRKARGGRARRSGRGGRIKPAHVAEITRQLSVLIGARVALADAYRGIAEQEESPRMRDALLDIAGRVQSGATLASAVAAHRAIFGDIYVETLRAAEQSGSLISLMNHLADMLERQDETRQMVRSALIYPVAVLAAIGAASCFLVVYVVPKFASMFAQRGARLPHLTIALQTVGESVKSYWWVYALCAVLVGIAARAVGKSPQGRVLADRFMHRVPYIRRVLVGLAVGRFARVFGLSLGAGVGLIESLDAAGRAAARPLLMRDTQRMIEQVRQGGRMSEVMRTCGYLPPFVVRMLSAGEECSELPRMCDIVARHYESETRRLVRNLATVVEPALIALLTGVVLTIALAIFLPMWDMVGLMK